MSYLQAFGGGGSGSGSVTQVNTTAPITGGPITTTGTISIADTTVTPGSYVSTNLTVDQKGRITAASSGNVARKVLQSNLDVYVATTGSDTTGDGTIGNPFATPRHAAAYVAGQIDGNQFDVTVHVAAGTYTDQVLIAPALSVNNYTFTGDTVTPSNVILKPNTIIGSQHSNFLVKNVTQNNFTVQGFTLDSTDAGFGGWAPLSGVNSVMSAFNCALVQVNNDNWYALTIFNGTRLTTGNLTITQPGTQTAMIQMSSDCYMEFFGSLTLSGTPTYSAATIIADEYCQILWEPSVSGTATGIPVALTNYSSFVDAATNRVPGTLDSTVDSTSSYAEHLGWTSGAGVPSTSVLARNTYVIYKDTNTGVVNGYYNDAGTVTNWTRELLKADRTYYVRTDGNNSNTGLVNSSGGAFLTIQHACDVAATLDFNGHTVTVQIVDGSYSETVIIPVMVGQATFSSFTLKGNVGTPANVSLTGTSGFAGAINAGQGSQCFLTGITITGAGSGYGIQATRGGFINFTGLSFNGSDADIFANGGTITSFSNYSIVGATGAGQHFFSALGGMIQIQGMTVTITGTPNYGFFAFADTVSSMQIPSITFSGSATGNRYIAKANGVIQTFGAGATYLPGNVAGSTSSGGQYL